MRRLSVLVLAGLFSLSAAADVQLHADRVESGNVRAPDARPLHHPRALVAEGYIRYNANRATWPAGSTPRPKGPKGNLFEMKPPCGDLWVAHEVTAIPMR